MFVEAVEGKGIIVHVNGDVLTGIGAIAGKRTLADVALLYFYYYYFFSTVVIELPVIDPLKLHATGY